MQPWCLQFEQSGCQHAKLGFDFDFGGSGEAFCRYVGRQSGVGRSVRGAAAAADYFGPGPGHGEGLRTESISEYCIW